MGKTVIVHGFRRDAIVDTVMTTLKTYLSDYIVEAIKLRPPKGNYSNCSVLVQFTTDSAAVKMVSLSGKMYANGSCLNVKFADHDIIPKPRAPSCTMNGLTMNFGCQLSNEKFRVLWTARNVSVQVGSGMKYWQFFFSHRSVEYRLDLSYESIWQVVLHRCPSTRTRYLVIQLYRGPRIFEKERRSSYNIYENPLFNYFRGGSDDQWNRTTDFTQSLIGQSSSLCLELPSDLQIPDLGESPVYYDENTQRFVLDGGSSFSRSFELVPIVHPPNTITLLYEILFKVNILVQRGFVPGSVLDRDFYSLLDHSKFPIEWMEHAMEEILHMQACCYDPCKFLRQKYLSFMKKKHVGSPNIAPDDGLVYVHRVQVTPTRVYFCGPELNVSNRVLRQYKQHIENFLRVSFVDEDLGPIHSNHVSCRSFDGTTGKTAIYRRILSTLKNGITIGDKKFEFLAFSASQLRDNSCWMFAASGRLRAADIRNNLGDFSRIRNVAKYAARLGQSFSSSTATFGVDSDEFEMIPDIKVGNGSSEYVFSDGIGKISSQFASLIARKCMHSERVPSAFQIRYGGFKGVIAVDPHSTKKLSLRKSMQKFESDSISLDVLEYSKHQPCFLNRQVITLLSTLGVPDRIFERMQKEVISQLDSILTEPLAALEALDLMGGDNTHVLREMLMCGFKPGSEPFLKMMLQTFRASKLQDLRIKSRIFVSKGRSMMGCLDETGILEYGQVFVQISQPNQRKHSMESFINKSSQPYVVTGKIIVAKNPCLHPGDIRILEAVNVQCLHHMVDCVVFPQKGHRPHPNECSGSDLDGDIYFVCWDSDLIPNGMCTPMDYSPKPPVLLDHDVTVEEIEEYFANSISNDSLGIIANAHTAFADKEYRQALSPTCIQLAEKFSVAVDFPKTGVPAELPSSLRVKEFPDFMEKPDKPTYISHRVIGKLFRDVKEISYRATSIETYKKEMAHSSYDPDMEVNGFEDYIDEAFDYKETYDFKLGNIIDYYGIKTESELLSGCVLKFSKGFDQRRDGDAIRVAVQSLKKEARSWFAIKKADSEDEDDAYAKASAWYYVTYHPNYWGCYNEGLKRDHYLSFPWCVYDKLVEIKKRKSRIRSRILSSSLESPLISRLQIQ